MPLVIGLVLLAGPGSSSAQESSRNPSPEELWNAYPLDSGGATLTVEQDTLPAEANSGRSPAPSGSDQDSGFPAWLVIALVTATATAFGAGVALGRGRRRETESTMAVGAEPPGEPPSPAAPERPFVRREYPPPARPAPPPPPPPRATAAGRGGRQ